MQQGASTRPGPVDDIPIDAIEASYDQRDLDRLDDHELVAAVAAVVAEPREGPADSFVLHAPLELTARARLLARTPPSDRRLARLRLVSIASRYQGHDRADLPADGDSYPDVAAAGDGPMAGVDHLLHAIDGGDLPAVDAAVRSLVADDRLDPARVIGPLAAAITPRTAAAAHGPIFLATLAEVPDRAAGWLPLLRPLARELARHPSWRIAWIDRHREAGPERPAAPDPEALFAVLADPPRLGPPGSSFIHPLLMQVDAPGAADELLGPMAGPRHRLDPTTARVLTRVAALAMVRDDPAHAPYGWTHCLTLPQAVLTLGPAVEASGGHPLAVAATQVLAFRVAQGSRTLDPADPLLTPADPVTGGERREALVVEAARRHDAHIAKYVLASLTAADDDPEAGELHLRAAEHLLAVWDRLGPDPADVLAGTGPS